MESVESYGSALSALTDTWRDENEFSRQIKAYYSVNTEYGGVYKALKRISENKKNETAIEDKSIARRLYRDNMNISASRVEEFYCCPFKYFCRYGLKAYPLKKAQVDAALSGTIIHYCLEVMISKFGRGLEKLDSDEIRKEVKNILNEFARENMNSNSGQTAKFMYNFNYHTDIVARLVERLKEEFSVSEFTPVEFEMPIADSADIKPYEVEASDGSLVRIYGSIDRVDLMEKNGKSYVRIVDYKSGTKEFDSEDVNYGLNCQMLIYLFALWKNGTERFPEFVPSGVLYFRANDKFVNVEEYMSEEEKNKSAASTKKMSGIVLDDEDVILGMDKSDSGIYIPASVNKKGGKLPLEEFVRFKKTVEKAIGDMAVKLHDGDTAIYPVEHGNYGLACDKCDYSAVCGINEFDVHRTKPYEEASENE